MSFERYTPVRVKLPRSVPHVSLMKTLQISINQAALELIGMPARVHLLFNKTTGEVGIEPAQAEDTTAATVTKHSGGSYRIAARGFINQFAIDVSTASAKTPELRDGLLIFKPANSSSAPAKKVKEKGAKGAKR